MWPKLRGGDAGKKYDGPISHRKEDEEEKEQGAQKSKKMGLAPRLLCECAWGSTSAYHLPLNDGLLSHQGGGEESFVSEMAPS